ncbi:MAG: sigma-70 family RNA polymerase sigma factor [Phycisphaera sp.]|nr:sigma-70 family RNA polymerase sigma factor [Phycisphaera sp.]
MPDNPHEIDDDRAEHFIRLLAENERRIAGYLVTLVPDWNDAEDILQEAKVAMWREFNNFELGTNFGAWACRIVFYRVLAHRKRRQRDRLRFTDAFYEAVSGDAIDDAEHLEDRCDALSGCIGKLNAEHRAILRMRYFEELDVERIADRTGRTVGAIYRVLSRIRSTLHDCVTQTLATEQGHG